MHVLLTGDRGHIGRHLSSSLRASGLQVRGFDRLEGGELLEPDEVRTAAAGCEAIVHAAALAHDTAGSPEDIMATNLLGTWHVLCAAEHVEADRVVFFSSAEVFGVAEGERPPSYFPVDDDHPLDASRAYGVSKRLAEDLCETFTRRTGISTICLRPVAVWSEDAYRRTLDSRQDDPSSEWQPFWEFGGFVDIRDVASAVRAALMVSRPGHVRAVLCASDISASAPTLQMVDRLSPRVPWRAGTKQAYLSRPRKALFDAKVAREALGWSPEHTWAEWVSTVDGSRTSSR